MISLKTTSKSLRVLDFDLENRPLSYYIPEFPTAEITAIASCWVGDLSSMEVLLLGPMTLEEMIVTFIKRYNEADIVTGHYIRKHDLPHLNGALLELGLPQLEPKLTSDTKLDMRKKQGVPATQEYLGEIMGYPMKTHMTQGDWRAANRLSGIGLKKTELRVTSDVKQHMLLREEMLKRDLLGPPKIWKG